MKQPAVSTILEKENRAALDFFWVQQTHSFSVIQQYLKPNNTDMKQTVSVFITHDKYKKH